MSTIQKINNFFGVESLSILRLDLPDPIAGGNKYFKLKYNLQEMKRQGHHRLLTFGGAFSNHIAAVATVGKKNNFETIGIIRGDELTEKSNKVLEYASTCGMKLIFVSREQYRKRNNLDFQNSLLEKFGPFYLLHEGGANELAVKGCREILSVETENYSQIVCPVGTGSTIAGIISSANSDQKIVGVAILQGRAYLDMEVAKYITFENCHADWTIEHGFTLGGYGKSSPDLRQFIFEMNYQYHLPLDEIYSGKTLFAITQMKRQGLLDHGNILFVHTGGYSFMH